MGNEADADWQAELAEWGAEDTKRALAEVEPHAYSPSALHMGDCAICGHLQGSAIHSSFRGKR